MRIYIENYKKIQNPGENNKSAIHRLQPLMLKTALADFPASSGIPDFETLSGSRKESLVLQARTAAGKPYLPSCPDFHYNFSDSGDYLVLAVSPEHEIGVDLQKLTPVRAGVIPMAERFFHPEDLALLRNTKDAKEQLKLFFRIWTIKEACLKCTGEGLSGGLNRFPVCFTTSQIGGLPFLEMAPPESGYVLTVCESVPISSLPL